MAPQLLEFKENYVNSVKLIFLEVRSCHVSLM